MLLQKTTNNFTDEDIENNLIFGLKDKYKIEVSKEDARDIIIFMKDCLYAKAVEILKQL